LNNRYFSKNQTSYNSSPSFFVYGNPAENLPLFPVGAAWGVSLVIPFLGIYASYIEKYIK
jgi:hypothetical protein